MSTLVKTSADVSAEAKRALLAERLRAAAGETRVVPLSFAQQRLWFLDQLHPGSPLYNIPVVLRLKGKLEFSALKRAVETIVERHESLRTRFICRDGEPAQLVDDSMVFKMDVIDLAARPEMEREQTAHEIVVREISTPFNLSTGPLLRVRLIRLTSDEHLLAINMHHIVSDEWSLKVLFRELAELYTAFAKGKPSSLSELAIQYPDYALWQREWLQGQVLEQQLDYWRKQLADAPAPLELPGDRTRPAECTLRGAREIRMLPRDTAPLVRSLAEQHGATTFMVLLAAFNTLLHRYTQHEDIIVGSPIAGRNRIEAEELIGFFVNTLALRTSLAGNPTFTELLGRIRETTLEAFAHQDLPFEKLVEELHPDRNGSHLQFSQIMFAVQGAGLDQVRMADLAMRFEDVHNSTAKFDITFILQETAEGYKVSVEYYTDLFERATIQRLLDHFEVLLAGILANPQQRLSELPLLTETERHELLVKWNDTRTSYPRDKSIAELFEAQVSRTPNAVAAVFGIETATYRELNARANQLARYLQKAGAGPGTSVALCVERSVEMIVAMLAILKAGAAYVPLDPAYPKDRLAFMLADSCAPLLLIQQQLLERMPRDSSKIICLDSDWELVARESRENPPNVATPESLAYVIYTSGSTGNPKGVTVPHRAIVRLVRNTNYIQLTPDDRIAQASNASFDAATFEVWGALLNGARVVGVTKEVTLSPRDFACELREQKITALFLTTALFNQLASEAPGAFEHVGTVMFGGEAVDPKWVRAVLRDRPPQRLLHVYGPTENTTFSSWHQVKHVVDGAVTIPIGAPIANTQFYVLDRHMRALPVGVPGELYVGGDGLATGYWNRPELTAEKFVRNPFSADGDDARLYRTGDLVRWLADGTIEFIGRIDRQVKIRGFRVELGEIETVLSQHPAVHECAVTFVANGTGHKRLVAYCVADERRSANATELRGFLREKLPDYMVPAVFVPLTSLPLTPNGKVDRNALPAPDHARPALERKYASPRDAVEQELTRIWEGVLGVHPIGIEDKFFDLGGHSLLAVRVIAQIEKAFGRKLRLATIFQAQTIEQLAAIIREEIKESSPTAGASLVEIQSRGSRSPLFFVHGAGGGMFWGYANLSRHLGADQPVYGLKSRGLDGCEELPTVEAMAAQYLEDIRAVQPRGPYCIGGYCFGGNVAFEMARQLKEQGEEVAFLALINCAPPNSRYTRITWTPRWFLRFFRNLLFWAKYFYQWSGPQRREFFRWKFETLRNKLSRLFGRSEAGMRQVHVGDFVDLSSYSAEQRRLWEAHLKALVNFHPRRFEGTVHLFRTSAHPLLCSFDHDYGWSEFARDAKVSALAGAHEKILEEPGVAALAAEVKKCLRATDKPASAPSTLPTGSLLRHLVIPASLFYLGSEAESLLLLEQTFRQGDLSLGVVFHHLAAVIGLGRNRKPVSDPLGTEQGKTEDTPLPTELPPMRAPREPRRLEAPTRMRISGYEVERAEISRLAMTGLRTLSEREGVPLAMVLFAVFKVFLSRYANDDGETEFMPVPVQQTLPKDACIHCFLNELVLATDLSGNPSVREVLRRIRKRIGTAQPNSFEAATPQQPLVEIRFGLEDHRQTAGADRSDSQPFPGFKLTLEQEAELLRVVAEFNPAIFERASVCLFLGHWQTLLEAAAAAPDSNISLLPMLSEPERRKLLVEWNETNVDFAIHETYIKRFEEQARRTPEAVAVRFRGTELTYAELDRRANQLGRHLQTSGVGPDVLVGVCLDRSPDLIVALLAAWKAGGAYLPLDPAYPKDRLTYMLADSRAPVLLTQIKFLSDFGCQDVRVICLDDPHEKNRIERCCADAPQNTACPDNLAYVIYTSGSTGRPKGVEVTHRSLLNHNLATARAYELTPGDAVLQFTPLSFDISVEEIFPSLLSGCAVVLRTDEAVSSVAHFVEFVRQERITVMNLPTAYWHELVEYWQTSPIPETVRLIVIGGEKASEEAFRRWRERAGDAVTLINTYGPTETTVIATLYRAGVESRSLPIGRPIANTQIYILDAQLQPVPVGVAGELYIGGTGLARGYLNRPDLTAERFIMNPFVPEARLYKTGDCARYRPDGNIEFVGRADQQVKIRGFRIEPGEIETVLRAHPAVKDAVVLAREDAPGKKKLVAYFVPRKSAAPRVGDLLHHLKRTLPPFMVPSTFVQMEAMPLTPGGKIDRRALPKPGDARPELEQRFVAPRTPLEEVLAGIWGEVLGLNRVGVYDNFFDLGGHSLLAMQVITRIRDNLQTEVPLASLFAMPTIAMLAEHLTEVSRESQPVLPVEVVSKGTRLPLTAAQRRIWFLDNFDPQQASYNLPTVFRLKGKLDLSALQRALTQLAGRHQALRAVFPAEDGQPLQLICEPNEVKLPLFDLRDAPEAERENRAAEIARQEARRSYILANPMLRTALIRLADEEHLLLLTMHDIAADWRSVEILASELVVIYGAVAGEREPELSPLSQQYSEVVLEGRLAPEEEMEQLDYWKRQLDGAPALLDLPADFQRPAHQSDEGARVYVSLDKNGADNIARLAEEEGCAPFMVLLAAFQTVLSRYTGTTDIVVGSTVSNRHGQAMENIIGHFENLIAYRTDLSGKPTFRELLGRVRHVSLGAFAHGLLPFERLLEELQPARNASYTPVFQVMFECQDALREQAAGGLVFNPVEVNNCTSKLDLTLRLERNANGFHGRIEYNTALFTASRMARMAEHFNTLLAAACKQPDARISELPLMTEKEAFQVLVEWNRTERDYPRNANLAQLFEAQVQRSPDAIALICGNDRFTYRDINIRANRLARFLRNRGVGPEVLVGVCTERNCAMIVGILGVLKAGGAYVPLDPAYPKDRLAFILEDAKAPVLLTQSSLRGLCASPERQVVCLDSDWTAIEAESPENLSTSVQPGNLAYVIYTSGSTGRPKGVALEHRSAVAFVHWAKGVFTSEQLNGVLASTSICFDLSIFELFVTLSAGGKVVLAENALALPGLPAANEVTMINTVPSAIRELLRVKGVPASVQVVNLAGEPLATGLVNQIYEQTSVRKVYDLYGPTETTTYSTCTLRQPNEPATIGRPLDNEQVCLLDSHLQAVPIGIPGELYIGGDGLARGYLNRPELTAEKFVANPLKPGARLYRTGDLARWREDGNLEFLGRIDHQVKIRGFRMELGEIETVLRQHSGLREVVVVAREDEPGDKRLVAYVVADATMSPTTDDLRRAIKQKLPEYMIPSAFVFLEAMPLTPNGKVDRKALPAPEQDRQSSSAEFVAPRDAIEARLAEIWCEVLRVKEVSVHDNFFELGGHSLMAIQIISRIREAFKVELPLFSLFDAPTIAMLASGLNSGEWTQQQLPVPPLERVPREDRLPVSFVQERLWFIDQLEPGSCAYNVPIAVRLTGHLDLPTLQRALDEIVTRHEALRTTFRLEDGALSQLVAPSQPLALKVIDLRELPLEERDARAQTLANAEAQQPFDLVKGPLVRVAIIQLTQTENVLVAVMHHTISDGWSLGIFFQELDALYSAFITGRSSAELPELPVQYADYAHWRKSWMQGATLERELDYWKAKLAGAPGALELPADRDVHSRIGHAGAQKTMLLPKDSIEALNAFSQRSGSTQFIVLLSALFITLHKWTEQRDIVLGTVVAGRSRRDIENVIGCFMNFLPLRGTIRDDETASELIARLKTTVLEAQSHQDCPFEKIVEAINPERRLNQNPLYNVAFLLQNFPSEIFNSGTFQARVMPVETGAALLDLRFEVEPTPEGLNMLCEYRTDLFEGDTITKLLKAYAQVIDRLGRGPQLPVAEFSITEGLAKQARASRERQDAVATRQTIAVAATFTAEPIEDSLRYWMAELDIAAEIRFAPYNQVFQQLLDPASALAHNRRGLNLVLIRLEDWQHAADASNLDEGPETILRRNLSEFVAAMRVASDRNGAPLLVCFCPPSRKSADGKSEDAERIEKELATELAKLSGVYVATSAELLDLYPVRDYYDASGDELGHVPYTNPFFSALGTFVARKFHALTRTAYKVIALDCDNTLWSGVCGEDGAQGVCIDAPRRALQEFMRAQFDSGMLLCLCTKNNEADAVEVFAQRNDMPLRAEHFAAQRVNWLPKSQNLKSLAAELNVGLDSFIFVDDNPVECAEVEASCPEVLTLLLPEDPQKIPQFLQHCWAFDHLKLTREDQQRTELYLQNRQREQSRQQAMSLADFISGLNLKIEIAPMSAEQLPRVAQLTQRTNQFNFTTRRRTEAEIKTLGDGVNVLTASVSDRFGDYGLVGVMIYRSAERALEVDTFLLSCRVLGRGVEHRMLARLGQIAEERQLNWVDAHYLPSAKNKPALEFLQNVGASFQQTLNGGFVFRFPARYAAEVEFDPQEAGERQQQKAESAPAYATTRLAFSQPLRKFTQCRRIAMECNDPVTIHLAVEASIASHTGKHVDYVAPRSELEQSLCGIWQNLLHVERVGVRDNFFDLGGHSLLAVRLFSEIEKLTGRKFPLVTLFQAPTIEQLAAVFSQAGHGAKQSPLVPIQPQGSKPPLVLVHGAGGDVVWGYANLAAYLSADQPVYGIKSRAQLGLEEFDSLELMAEYYLGELRKFQPHGPYFLGGYCFGGNVAYEMARQLREQGENVALLALLDTSPANAGYERITWWRPRFSIRFTRNLMYWLKDFRELKAEDRRRFIGRKLRSFGRKFLHNLRPGGGNGEVDLEEVIDLTHFPENELKLWRVHLRALIEHVQQPYDGPVTLLRTRGQQLFCSLEEDFCWSKLVRDVAVKRIPGSHENIFMEPNVRFLAKELDACLAEAQASSGNKKV